MESTRTASVRLGIRIEFVTILWMVVEMVVSIWAGIAAGSILLVAFGIDSLLELVSGAILLWRLQVEGRGGNLRRVEQTEHRASRIVAIILGLLCIYVLAASVYGLLTHSTPDDSWIGIGISGLAVLVMPYLAVTKLRIARMISSKALEGDAANSITCAAMAATVLVGLLLNTLFGWWWAEEVAALLFLVWLVRETIEAFEEARQDEE